MTQARVVSWFSCGAASAVASKKAIERYGERADVVYCDTMASEHPDNARFFRDVETWLKVKVRRIKSDKFDTIDDVFESRKYMVGMKGAPCTVEMKKVPRFKYQRADDVHVFGFTNDAEDRRRIPRFKENNPELALDFILVRMGISKAECLGILKAEGIKTPTMYDLGYRNNNCIGCVKATSPGYWNMVRRDFPEVFARRAEQSRRIGARLVRVDGVRVFLDELDPNKDTKQYPLENVSCGPDCGQMELFDE